MDFKRFSLSIVMRTVLAMLTIIILTQVMTYQGFHATLLLLSILLIYQLIELTRFIARTNTELVRFFDAVRHADFSQRFELKELGTGFDELGATFDDVLKRIQLVRSSRESELRHVKAIIEHVPVPLLSISDTGLVTLWNNSARRLFGTHTITKVEDLAKFDGEFPKKLQSILAGEKTLINIFIDDMEHKLIVSATEIVTTTHKETLVSLQDIQSELAIAQLQAWQDLVSVLTHEIMNSITPVASLSKTAVDLVGDVREKIKHLSPVPPDVHEELDDVFGAVQTVARRSDSLMQFVTSYRRLTRLPSPDKKFISITKLFEHVTLLTTQQWKEKKIHLVTSIIPAELDVSVDVDMVEQVLINLLRNAEQAMKDSNSPKVTMKAFLNVRGHVVIEVEDNGEGFEINNEAQIFVPFFTTKQDGSGVGLALTRQVMIAHGGIVNARNNSQGGATFSLIF